MSSIDKYGDDEEPKPLPSFIKICEYRGLQIWKDPNPEHGYFVYEPSSILKVGLGRISKEHIASDLNAMKWIDGYIADKE